MAYRIYHCELPGGNASFVCKESVHADEERIGVCDRVNEAEARLPRPAAHFVRAEVGAHRSRDSADGGEGGGSFELLPGEQVSVGSEANSNWIVSSPRMPPKALEAMRVVDTLFVRAPPGMTILVDGQRVAALWVPAPPGTRVTFGGVVIAMQPEGRLKQLRSPTDSFVPRLDADHEDAGSIHVDLSLPAEALAPKRRDQTLRRTLHGLVSAARALWNALVQVTATLRASGACVREQRDSHC